jgi:[ribosomal protein S5]-alanine N-acetyltransferase
MSWRQTSREAAQAWLERRMRDEQLHGVSMWAVEDRELHQLIGLCGFFPRGEPELALGYVITALLWGRGLASEAVTAAVGAALAAGYQVYATIRPWNTASLRVAEKVGLQRSGSIEDERGELLVFKTAPAASVR